MPLTLFELSYLLAEPMLPVLHRRTRQELKVLLPRDSTPSLLDVGGRVSPYTVGLRAEVTVIDLPRESQVQSELHLGLSQRGLHSLSSQRSNVVSVLVGDVLSFDFTGGKFDAITSIEVIEHIDDDRAFVRRLRELVHDDGFVYLTTPNGDYVKNEPPHYNPDHVRHYDRQGLHHLLSEQFDDVIVNYAIQTGLNRVRGMRISPRHPLGIPRAAWANHMNERESRYRAFMPLRSAHLVAVARPKKPS